MKAHFQQLSLKAVVVVRGEVEALGELDLDLEALEQEAFDRVQVDQGQDQVQGNNLYSKICIFNDKFVLLNRAGGYNGGSFSGSSNNRGSNSGSSFGSQNKPSGSNYAIGYSRINNNQAPPQSFIRNELGKSLSNNKLGLGYKDKTSSARF